ncbi:hypothetical protein LV779_19130 [Streptomyces thinghirensis]|nr:hypothetical protein [Streptomyces thinghirensis]
MGPPKGTSTAPDLPVPRLPPTDKENPPCASHRLRPQSGRTTGRAAGPPARGRPDHSVLATLGRHLGLITVLAVGTVSWQYLAVFPAGGGLAAHALLPGRPGPRAVHGRNRRPAGPVGRAHPGPALR